MNLGDKLPILSKLALDYIWLPISSCSVERSFSIYNNILDENRQNLSEDSLKRLNMMYFNNQIVINKCNLAKFFIGTNRFGLIIGSQGKTINRLIQETGVEIDLQSDGFALLYHHDEKQLIKAVQFIKIKLEKKIPL